MQETKTPTKTLSLAAFYISSSNLSHLKSNSTLKTLTSKQRTHKTKYTLLLNLKAPLILANNFSASYSKLCGVNKIIFPTKETTLCNLFFYATKTKVLKTWQKFDKMCISSWALSMKISVYSLMINPHIFTETTSLGFKKRSIHQNILVLWCLRWGIFIQDIWQSTDFLLSLSYFYQRKKFIKDSFQLTSKKIVPYKNLVCSRSSMELPFNICKHWISAWTMFKVTSITWWISWSWLRTSKYFGAFTRNK